MVSNRNRFIVPTRQLGAGKDSNGLSVIIMAGSIGYRMKSFGPKSLLKMPDGATLIQKQIETIQLVFPNAEIILSVGFRADKVIRYIPRGLRVVENQLYETTNYVEEARLGINNAIHDNILLITGDLLFDTTAIDGINFNGSAILIDNHNNLPPNEVGVTIVDNIITILAYGISNLWGQIVFLTGKELKLFRHLISQPDKARLYIFEVLNQILEQNGKLYAFCPDKLFIRKLTG